MAFAAPLACVALLALLSAAAGKGVAGGYGVAGATRNNAGTGSNKKDQCDCYRYQCADADVADADGKPFVCETEESQCCGAASTVTPEGDTCIDCATVVKEMCYGTKSKCSTDGFSTCSCNSDLGWGDVGSFWYLFPLLLLPPFFFAIFRSRRRSDRSDSAASSDGGGFANVVAEGGTEMVATQKRRTSM